MAKIPKKLLREIYNLHRIIGEMKSAYQNDRGARAERMQELWEEGLVIGQKIIDSQDPL